MSLQSYKIHNCYFRGLRSEVTVMAFSRILQQEFKLKVDEAFLLVKKLRMGETLGFDFANYEEMVACSERMEAAGIEQVGLSADPEFDKERVLIESADFLQSAADFSFRFDEAHGYHNAHRHGEFVAWLWENEFIAQFVFAEMVKRGAKVVSER